MSGPGGPGARGKVPKEGSGSGSGGGWGWWWDVVLKLGWFSSGKDAAARNLLVDVWGRKERGELPVELDFVFCDRDRGEAPETKAGREGQRFFELVDRLGIPLVTLSRRTFMPELRARALEETADPSRPSASMLEWRDAYGARVIELIHSRGHRAELAVLAGYMLIWSRAECEAFRGLNLHPALPWGPTGTWQEVIWELVRQGATEQGVMMHLVTPELDRGPPVAYCRFPLRGGRWDALWRSVEGRTADEVKAAEGARNPLFLAIRADGERRELPLIARTVGEFARGGLRIKGWAPCRGEHNVERGADLTEDIERELAIGGGR